MRTPPSEDEGLIRTNIEQELMPLKERSGAEYEEMVDGIKTGLAASSDDATLEMMGISADDITEAFLDGFDYEIGTIAVDGAEATADVIIHVKTVSSILSAFTEVGSQMQQDPSVAAMSLDEAYEWAGRKVIEAIEQASPETNELTLEYEKKDGSWQMTSESEYELGTVFIA